MPFSVDPATHIACFTDGAQVAPDGTAKPGGTWLGVNLKSRAFAALTNSRNDYTGRRGEISRGYLVSDYLRWANYGVQAPDDDSAAHDTAFAYLAPHDEAHEDSRYDGYNFVACPDLAAAAAGRAPLLYSTNRTHGAFADGATVPARGIRLEGNIDSNGNPTVHVIANSFLDNWAEPKSAFLKQALEHECRNLQSLQTNAADFGVIDQVFDRLGDVLSHRGCGTCLGSGCVGAGADHVHVGDPETVDDKYSGAQHIFVAGVKDAHGVHATRTQSVIVVERVVDADGEVWLRSHYAVRDVNSTASIAFSPWQAVTAGDVKLADLCAAR